MERFDDDLDMCDDEDFQQKVELINQILSIDWTHLAP